MNQFGGKWTEQKIELVVAYTKAYLTIMNKYPQFKILYFDGFAGSGDINKEEEGIDVIKGTAVRILEISHPRTFDLYYFVEKNQIHKEQLEQEIKLKFPSRKFHVVREDCNKKLIDMSKFLTEKKSYRVLAFVDPYGMSLNWSSIEALKGLGIDLWILVPTGIGVNRLLKKDGNISEGWLKKLEKFLGITREEIKSKFYKKLSHYDLFGEDLITIQVKENNVINKIHDLYKERLNTVFKYVSDTFVLRNSSNSIMYHFMMATNNSAALRIANDIIKPKFKI